VPKRWKNHRSFHFPVAETKGKKGSQRTATKTRKGTNVPQFIRGSKKKKRARRKRRDQGRGGTSKQRKKKNTPIPGKLKDLAPKSGRVFKDRPCQGKSGRSLMLFSAGGGGRPLREKNQPDGGKDSTWKKETLLPHSGSKGEGREGDKWYGSGKISREEALSRLRFQYGKKRQ